MALTKISQIKDVAAMMPALLEVHVSPVAAWPLAFTARMVWVSQPNGHGRSLGLVVRIFDLIPVDLKASGHVPLSPDDLSPDSFPAHHLAVHADPDPLWLENQGPVVVLRTRGVALRDPKPSPQASLIVHHQKRFTVHADVQAQPR